MRYGASSISTNVHRCAPCLSAPQCLGPSSSCHFAEGDRVSRLCTGTQVSRCKVRCSQPQLTQALYKLPPVTSQAHQLHATTLPLFTVALGSLLCSSASHLLLGKWAFSPAASSCHFNPPPRRFSPSPPFSQGWGVASYAVLWGSPLCPLLPSDLA